MNLTLILIFGGGMLAVSFVIKVIEMSGNTELAKQVEMAALLIGFVFIVATLGTLINETKSVFGM